ncbi:MAG: ferredoxin [Mycobacterium sp.]|jgi:ferredoxin|nr:ferredoxin [Actinoplanes sp.]MDT5040514.1 ferredoxin [Actinoplanes sp.]MDT5345998.1 ferredoxin [Mycobacterium sp.]
MAGMHISLERDRCIGAGQCVLSAPDVFDQTDDGLVVLLTSDVTETEVDAVEQAGRHCPSGTIRFGRD